MYLCQDLREFRLCFILRDDSLCALRSVCELTHHSVPLRLLPLHLLQGRLQLHLSLLGCQQREGEREEEEKGIRRRREGFCKKTIVLRKDKEDEIERERD